jgi:hypothetical protein
MSGIPPRSAAFFGMLTGGAWRRYGTSSQEASSLGLLGMIEHYQKRIEASRYLNIAGWLGVDPWHGTISPDNPV